MTKQVRIENADLSTHKVVIEIWEKSLVEGVPDRHAETHTLHNPTQIGDFYVTGTRYLVIKELSA